MIDVLHLASLFGQLPHRADQQPHCLKNARCRQLPGFYDPRDHGYDQFIWGNFWRNERGPVSYTHLDVYKRQLFNQDQGMARLVEKVLNKVLEAEVAEQLQAGPYLSLIHI